MGRVRLGLDLLEGLRVALGGGQVDAGAARDAEVKERSLGAFHAVVEALYHTSARIAGRHRARIRICSGTTARALYVPIANLAR